MCKRIAFLNNCSHKMNIFVICEYAICLVSFQISMFSYRAAIKKSVIYLPCTEALEGHFYLLLITYYLLLITYHLLIITYYLLLITYYLLLITYHITGPRSAVSNVSGNRCESDCRSRGRKFDPGPVPYFRGD